MKISESEKLHKQERPFFQGQNGKEKGGHLFLAILASRQEKRTFLFMELFGLWGYLQPGGGIYDSQGKNFHNLGSLWT